jgi:GT2 family glycosyltransferase
VKLSIIYVNYNTTDVLLDSLRSLGALDGLFEYEVIVVDNASTYFDREAVLEVHPGAKIIDSPKNIGFGKGNNLGAAAATGDYLWILNTDTIVPSDHHLERLIDFLDTHSEYGAAGPLLTNQEGEVQPTQAAYFPTPGKVLLGTPMGLMVRLVPAFKPLAARFNYDYRSLDTSDVEVLVAAALVVRRSVFEEVGGFSSEFFFFYEDSDLCRKIWQTGRKIRFMREVHIIHLWGQSIRGKRSFYRRKVMYFSSQDIYFRKWYSEAIVTLLRIARWPLLMKYRLFNR